MQKEDIQAPFYLESQNHLFTGMRESKTDLSNFGITTLDQYIQAVLDNNNNKTGTVKTYNEDGMNYKYAYTSTVNEQTFGYMMIAMEGEDHFYTMNFGCLESKLDDYKDKYFDWAKTITVE